MNGLLTKLWDFSLKNFGLPVTMLLLVVCLGGYGAYAGYENSKTLTQIQGSVSNLLACCDMAKVDSAKVVDLQSRVKLVEENIATIKAQNEIVISILMQMQSQMFK